MSNSRQGPLPSGKTLIRNKKKKEKFDGLDPSLKPRHRPYARKPVTYYEENENE